MIAKLLLTLALTGTIHSEDFRCCWMAYRRADALEAAGHPARVEPHFHYYRVIWE